MPVAQEEKSGDVFQDPKRVFNFDDPICKKQGYTVLDPVGNRSN